MIPDDVIRSWVNSTLPVSQNRVMILFAVWMVYVVEHAEVHKRETLKLSSPPDVILIHLVSKDLMRTLF